MDWFLQIIPEVPNLSCTPVGRGKLCTESTKGPNVPRLHCVTALPPVAYRLWCGCLSPHYFLLRPSLLFPSLNSTHFLWCHIHLICSLALCFKKKKKKIPLVPLLFSRKEYTQFLNEIFYMDVRICGACAENVAVHLNLQCSHLPPSVLPFIPGRPPG